MSKSTLASRLAAPLLSLALAAIAVPPSLEPVPPRGDERVLEFVVDTTLSDVDGKRAALAARALDAVLAQQEGHVATWRADSTEGAGRTLRATIWASVEAAESASLALDGTKEVVASTGVFDESQHAVAHFRRLREHSYSEAACGHLEVVVFRTRPGVTREANLQKFDAAEAEFAKGKGLLGHSLWLAPDGRWVHLLRWAGADDYASTGKALFVQPGVGGWIRSLDFKRFQVARGDVVRD